MKLTALHPSSCKVSIKQCYVSTLLYAFLVCTATFYHISYIYSYRLLNCPDTCFDVMFLPLTCHSINSLCHWGCSVLYKRMLGNWTTQLQLQIFICEESRKNWNILSKWINISVVCFNYCLLDCRNASIN
jgi:hypothetical protein